MGDDSPRIRVLAPVTFLIVFLIGLALRPVFPLRLEGNTTAGVVLLAISLWLDFWGMWTMWRARTHILPHQPAHSLVGTGPFRFSRNPLYIGMIVGYLSAVVWIGSLPSLILLPIALFDLRYRVIEREERYLERRFGDEYRSYRSSVRRWL